MKRVATAAVLIPLVLLAVFKVPTTPYLAWIVGVVAFLASKEYLDIISHYGVRPMRWPVYLAVASVFVLANGFFNRPTYREVLLIFALLWFLLLMCIAMRYTDLREGTIAVALSSFALPYVGLTLFCLLAIHRVFGGWFFVILVFLAVWVGDTAAYYVGRSRGRHKLAPRISPGKTWEGAIASALFSALVTAAWAYSWRSVEHFATSDSWYHMTADYPNVPMRAALSGITPSIAAILGLIINIAAQLGDLAESMIKRGAGVKDSGTVLPGHGGILDRIDALLFAAPVALLLFTLLDRYLLTR